MFFSPTRFKITRASVWPSTIIWKKEKKKRKCVAVTVVAGNDGTSRAILHERATVPLAARRIAFLLRVSARCHFYVRFCQNVSTMSRMLLRNLHNLHRTLLSDETVRTLEFFRASECSTCERRRVKIEQVKDRARSSHSRTLIPAMHCMQDCVHGRLSRRTRASDTC